MKTELTNPFHNNYDQQFSLCSRNTRGESSLILRINCKVAASFGLSFLMYLEDLVLLNLEVVATGCPCKITEAFLGFFHLVLAASIVRPWKLCTRHPIAVAPIGNEEICLSSEVGAVGASSVDEELVGLGKELLLHAEGEEEGLPVGSVHVGPIFIRSPGVVGEASNDLTELRLHQKQGIFLVVAMLVKGGCFKLMI